jgi:hypothetical protein
MAFATPSMTLPCEAGWPSRSFDASRRMAELAIPVRPSWGSPSSGAPLESRHACCSAAPLARHSDRHCRLSADIPLRVHSRRDESRHRLLGATRAVSFRPRGFPPPRRLPPHNGPGRVAAPTGHEVRRVSALSGVPATPYPSTNSPRQQQYHITVASALLPLPLIPEPPTHQGGRFPRANAHSLAKNLRDLDPRGTASIRRVRRRLHMLRRAA